MDFAMDFQTASTRRFRGGDISKRRRLTAADEQQQHRRLFNNAPFTLYTGKKLVAACWRPLPGGIDCPYRQAVSMEIHIEGGIIRT